jgi:hypothetical protein
MLDRRNALLGVLTVACTVALGVATNIATGLPLPSWLASLYVGERAWLLLAGLTVLALCMAVLESYSRKKSLSPIQEKKY